MITYLGLRSAQSRTQQIPDQFSAAEKLWRSLKAKQLGPAQGSSGAIAGASQTARLTRFCDIASAKRLYRFSP
jgi:hypothetical protein